MIEAVMAVVIAAALLWLVAQPMLFPSALVVDPIEPPDPEETPRGQALMALKEIEFDRATGKLSDADFTTLHDKYSAAAIAVLEPVGVVEAGNDAIEALITTRALRIPGPRCVTHGTAGDPGARFCPTCGAGLLATAGTCLGCGTVVPGDAVFCPGCGARVKSA
jgi:hypothetical protein